MVALTPPEDRKDIVVPMFTALAGLGEAALDPIGNSVDLGRKLVLE